MQDLVKFVEDHLKAHGSTADAASLNAAATILVSEVSAEVSAEVAAEVAAETIAETIALSSTKS